MTQWDAWNNIWNIIQMGATGDRWLSRIQVSNSMGMCGLKSNIKLLVFRWRFDLIWFNGPFWYHFCQPYHAISINVKNGSVKWASLWYGPEGIGSVIAMQPWEFNHGLWSLRYMWYMLVGRDCKFHYIYPLVMTDIAKMVIYSGFTHWTWWFYMIFHSELLVYQRVYIPYKSKTEVFLGFAQIHGVYTQNPRFSKTW